MSSPRTQEIPPKKKFKYEGLPGFDRDPETGRYFPVYVDFKAVFGDKTEKPTPSWKLGNAKKSNERDIVRLVKGRKNEIGVRKELFKVPAADWRPPPWTYKGSRTNCRDAGQSSSKTLLASNSLNQIDKLKKKNISLLISVEKQREMKSSSNEEEESNQLKTPKTKSSIKDDSENCVKTPDSDSEFVNLEEQCQTPKMVADSPVSAVCNLFENKMMLTNVKGELVDEEISNEKIINEINRTIKLDEELCKDTANKIKEVMEQQMKHEQNINLIKALVNKLDGGSKHSKTQQDEVKDENKENSLKRRSLRLQNKISPKNRGAVGSPVILKSGDLRKTTLTKSLVNKYQKYQIDSPRIKKALDLYNTTKKTCNVLLSPKISIHQFEETADSDLRNNLSMKVQRQCFMLQDTPKHK